MENKRYNLVIEQNYSKNEIKEILKNVSNIEQIKNYVQENLNKSKLLLNDIENVQEIYEYLKENGYLSVTSNIIEMENLYDISFINIDYYNKNDIMKSRNFTENYDYPIILKQISKKVFFIDFLDNIYNLILEIIECLKNTITFKKHLIILNDIEHFLNIFYDIIYYNEQYNFEKLEQFPKYFKMDLNNFENNPKNIYKCFKHSFLKILNVIYKIINENVL